MDKSLYYFDPKHGGCLRMQQILFDGKSYKYYYCILNFFLKKLILHLKCYFETYALKCV